MWVSRSKVQLQRGFAFGEQIQCEIFLIILPEVKLKDVLYRLNDSLPFYKIQYI